MKNSINFYGLLISVAAFAGLLISKSRAKLYAISENQIENAFFITLFTGIVGARSYHVIDKWSYYGRHMQEIFFIWQGGIAIYGALIGGFLGIWVFSKLAKLSLLKLLDCIVPSIALGQAIGRIGNYFNQEGFGPPTTLPWGIAIPSELRPAKYQDFEFFHPTFFYESILCLILFVILIALTKKLVTRSGFLTAIYLVGYGGIRFFTETFRSDTALVFGVKTAYFLSFIFIVIGLVMLSKIRKRI
ncbi:MAG: prolipoprotein diacylglyceryl transferase [Candidatus Woykebacteria bacterium RIFCSPHIGHO2_12_FULL_43_10]|uniref:Phosphatidylglycerol--prolipoprotein diacylglyceryl transferase n=2 Tax=Candidatus Woykeibacteriota TaxID=1817899 RepID=A0A1G1WX13_9BACT|nr:MAG: prolipoprotein diacylglyceryl transferase [Candidatus Woykebacteria bacterium RIFCSPHIGHO2_01_FULL_43_29]OGY28614.1 MAG: prolipoprotein diacylglyceryl transferase [Candidatus Woykebacteria bacterium RIFCSPHIGHO2_02_FULL_43_16b]OGY28766.1 MAG: prolipoprotein diacylglyceryl transferase [Candidatus Woykebacteria bacterium RIFCSPHIGHO2_12_FULL_43_10]OGY32296.1 MAG: prolipoprotein diacylglyceryl transferase [Candidatus Woykebacteria bacterium RIFCSPLOWO2_01_FULL_43_14]